MIATTHIPVEHSLKTAPLAASALSVLLYYDLFRYPLTAQEILQHCRLPGCNRTNLDKCLRQLVDERLIFQQGDFYSLKDEPPLIERREKGNAMAAQMMKKAAARAAFISHFPYVRSVCVSGSLSKNYFDETTDIDFFIITAPNRLWLCRSLLILYKKIFLLNSKKYFCVNYFIDSENLEIPDKNIFTATEIITLIPFYNYELYSKFFQLNNWVKEFYPNSSKPDKNVKVSEGDGWMKKKLEQLFNSPIGEWFDRYFYSVTVRHWKKKFHGFSREEFEVNMRSRKDVSKHHPQGFQFQVLKAFQENCRAFEEKHRLIL